MEGLLLTLVSVFGASTLAFILAWMAGQLVAGSRLDAANETIRRLEDSARTKDEANAVLKGIVDRQALVADVTAAVLQAIPGAVAAQGAAGRSSP